MQLVYFIGIFEDNHNIARDRFATGSVNVMKNRPLVVKKHKVISICTNLAKSHQKTMGIVTRYNDTQNFRKTYWFMTNC